MGPIYSNSALGDEIEARRLALGMTQVDLATEADFGKGGGVSISRIENGHTRPSPDSLARLAKALRMDVESLESAAAARTDVDSPGVQSTGSQASKEVAAHKKQVQARVDRRAEQIARAVDAYSNAYSESRDRFIVPMDGTLGAIDGVPRPSMSEPIDAQINDPARLAQLKVAVTALGVQEHFAEHSTDTGDEDPEGVLNTLAAGVSEGARTAVKTFSSDSNRALTGALVGLSATATRRVGAVGLASLVGAAVFLPALAGAVAGLAFITGVGARRRVQEEKQLKQTEDALEAQAEFDEAFVSALGRATEILYQIAVYGSRYLERWEQSLPEPPRTWGDLNAAQQAKMADLWTLAACHLAVTGIDFEQYPRLGAIGDSAAAQQVIDDNDHLLDAARAEVWAIV